VDDLWDRLRLTSKGAGIALRGVAPHVSKPTETTIMNRYFNRRSLFNAFTFAVGLMAGLGATGGADATDYNRLISKPRPVVELVPANQGPPVRIIAPRPAF
jgi:hypothetical protein